MDFMSIIGISCGFGMYAWGIYEGGAMKAFLNPHGIVLVVVGTIFASMLTCPPESLLDFLRAGLRGVFMKPKGPDANDIITIVGNLAKAARQNGFDSLEKEVHSVPDDGFIMRAFRTCLTSPDEITARNILERELMQTDSRHREIIAVYKTMGLITPMMGLLGTVIGIVSVLRNISDPSQVGSSMGVAMSTAFYGILLSGFVFTPMAGKLRLRHHGELLGKELALEGLLALQFTNLSPRVIERRLISYLRGGAITSHLK